MAVNDVVRAAIIGTYDGQTVVNVLHFQQKPASSEDLTVIKAAVEALLDVVKVPLMPQMTWTNLRLTKLLNPPQTFEYDLTKAGTGAGTDGVPGVAAVITSWKTQYAGRSYRGRNYWAGLSEGLSTYGQIQSAAQSTMSASLATWLQTWGATGTNPTYQVGVWSRKTGANFDSAGKLINYNVGAGFTPYTSVIVRNALGSQRNRRYAT